MNSSGDNLAIVWKVDGPMLAIIPEYPFGLFILALFMIIGYAVIRRRTVTKQK